MTVLEIPCPFCGKAFGNKQEVISHSVNVHPGKPVVAELDAKYPDPQQDVIDVIEHQKKVVEAAQWNRQLQRVSFGNRDDVTFCCDVILKEAKEEYLITKQLVYTMLSAYTNNPVNLAINSPTGTGKTHAIMKASALFPKMDVMLLAGMTDKAIFQ